MNDQMMGYLRNLSERPDDAEKMKEQSDGDRSAMKAAMVADAAEHGFTITEAEFAESKQAPPPATDGVCVCTAGGGGKAGPDSSTGACVLGGVGMGGDGGNTYRCVCPMVGGGRDM